MLLDSSRSEAYHHPRKVCLLRRGSLLHRSVRGMPLLHFSAMHCVQCRPSQKQVVQAEYQNICCMPRWSWQVQPSDSAASAKLLRHLIFDSTWFPNHGYQRRLLLQRRGRLTSGATEKALFVSACRACPHHSRQRSNVTTLAWSRRIQCNCHMVSAAPHLSSGARACDLPPENWLCNHVLGQWGRLGSSCEFY